MPEPLHCSWACLTHEGHVRENNEDSMVMLALEADGTLELEDKGTMEIPERGCIAVVADGMGGVRGGELASQHVREGILEMAGSKICPSPKEPDLQKIINEINLRILRIAEKDPSLDGMGTTLTLAWLCGRELTLANVGDSRLYKFRSNTLEQLSHDQSPVGRLLREKRITVEESRTHPHRNVIDQAVGTHIEGINPETKTYTVENGDLYLLCSDGLNEELWDHEIAQTLQDGQRTKKPLLAMAEDLVAKALLAEGKDNITVILLQLHGLASKT